MNTENRKRALASCLHIHPAFLLPPFIGSYDNLSGTASGSKSGTTSGESDIPTKSQNW